MPSIKVYPPNQLPDRGVNETQFNIWVEELEVYLSQEADYRVFLAGEDYAVWESQENNPARLTDLKGSDIVLGRTGAQISAQLKLRQRQLRTVLSIVGKCVSIGHYDSVMRHSISLESIYDMLRSDYDMKKKGIHFFNLLDMHYEATKLTPIAFYNQYRTMITSNLAKQNDVLKYKNNHVMAQDEKMTPMLEDIILLDVVREINSRLPAFIRTFYTHKMSMTDKLMDFKNDIFNNIPKFLEDLNKDEQLSSIKTKEVEPVLSAFRNPRGGGGWRGRGRGNPPGGGGNPPGGNGPQNNNLYCRLCHKCDMPRAIYTSHNIGSSKCTQLSAQDRNKLNNHLSHMVCEDEIDDRQLAAAFGYEENIVEQVNNTDNCLETLANNISRFRSAKLGYTSNQNQPRFSPSTMTSKTKMLFTLNWTLEPPSIIFVNLRLLCCVVKYSLMVSCQHLVMD